MPSWFAVDQWFPALFEVKNICSYTPEIAFGISMAEALMGIAFVVCLITLLGLGLLLRPTEVDNAHRRSVAHGCYWLLPIYYLRPRPFAWVLVQFTTAILAGVI